MRRNYSNTAVATTLAAGISDSDTTLTVADATGYPDAPFTITIGSEVILVGAKDGTTFSALTRGYDGTVAAAHDSGAGVEHAVVAEDMGPASILWYSLDPFQCGYIIGSAIQTQNANRQLGNGTIGFVPFSVRRKSVLTVVSVSVATAGSADGVLKLLLYGSTPDFSPDGANLLATIGTIDTTTTGLKNIQGLNIVLDPGTYWVGAYCSGFTTTPFMVCAMTDRGGFPFIAKDATRVDVHRPPAFYASATSETDFGLMSTNDLNPVPVFGIKLDNP